MPLAQGSSLTNAQKNASALASQENGCKHCLTMGNINFLILISFLEIPKLFKMK